MSHRQRRSSAGYKWSTFYHKTREKWPKPCAQCVTVVFSSPSWIHRLACVLRCSLLSNMWCQGGGFSCPTCASTSDIAPMLKWEFLFTLRVRDSSCGPDDVVDAMVCCEDAVSSPIVF